MEKVPITELAPMYLLCLELINSLVICDLLQVAWPWLTTQLYWLLAITKPLGDWSRGSCAMRASPAHFLASRSSSSYVAKLKLPAKKKISQILRSNSWLSRPVNPFCLGASAILAQSVSSIIKKYQKKVNISLYTSLYIGCTLGLAATSQHGGSRTGVIYDCVICTVHDVTVLLCLITKLTGWAKCVLASNIATDIYYTGLICCTFLML